MKSCRFSPCIAALFLIMLTGLTGCGKAAAPDPSLARCDLLNRMFAALQEARNDEALRLLDKLRRLDPDNLELAEMQSRILGNIYAAQCSRLLAEQGVAAALAAVREARKEHPMHLRLRQLEETLGRLQELEAAAAVLAAAETPDALAAALERIEPMSASFPAAARLRVDIALRRLELGKMRSDAPAPESKP